VQFTTHETAADSGLARNTSRAETRLVAFMDIGTNSMRFSVVRIHANHTYSILTQHKEMVRLGEGEFTEQRLLPEAMDRVIMVARQFRMLAASYGVHDMVAVATAATREAVNQRLFLQRLRQEAHVDVHVVSGLEEARLIYLGVASGVHLRDKQALFIDIGGGSTEIIVGTQHEPCYLNSLKLGAIRLSMRFLADPSGPVPSAVYAEILQHVQQHAVHTVQELRPHRIDLAVGSSGTIENLAEIAARMFWKRAWQRDDVLTYAHLIAVRTHLAALALDERRKVPGLNPARADIILAGTAILEALMHALDIAEIHVSDRGLRDGLLVDYLLKHGHTAEIEGMTVRLRSVLQLGRTCRFHEAHARTTARLALALFDSAQAAQLHDFGPWERELLEYAALLHHIGAFLTYSNYQAHTYYLIRNAELLGFDQTEIAIIAATALYHRKALPRKKHPEFSALSLHAQHVVRSLCVLLRLAESLDRSHAGIVQHACFTVLDSTHVRLHVYATQDCHIELRGVDKHLDAFRKTFGRSLVTCVEHDHPYR
jgi:exopolyphosphatase/guanosine-5'-triphosphate,3'-diphosphate pyrophosphatase